MKDTEVRLDELEIAVKKITAALVVHGIIERDMPKPKEVSRPKVVARNVQHFPSVQGAPNSLLATFSCECVKKAHRQAILGMRGQTVTVVAECGTYCDVEIPKE